jgi:transcriptional regulator with XRE-family HTH domain
VINNRDKKFLKAFGDNLRELRIDSGLSQHELALKADINKNQVGNIERGEVNPTITTLNSIAKALKIPSKNLLEF